MTMTMESNMLFGSIGAGTKQDVVTFVPAAACSAVAACRTLAAVPGWRSAAYSLSAHARHMAPRVDMLIIKLGCGGQGIQNAIYGDYIKLKLKRRFGFPFQS